MTGGDEPSPTTRDDAPEAAPAGPPAPGYRSDGHRLLAELQESTADIARALGVSRPLVSYWRNGRKEPTLVHREGMERAFRIPASAWERPPGSSPAASSSPAAVSDGVPAAVAFPAATATGGPGEGELTIDQIDRWLRMLDEVRDKWDATATAKVAAAQRAQSLLALRSKILGDTRTEEDKLAASPTFRGIVNALVGALAPFPEALKAARAALARLL